MKRIFTTRHAVAQAELRFCEIHPAVNIEALILDEVADAIRAKRVQDYRPEGFRLYGQKNGKLPAGQLFYWDETETRGYVVVRGENRAHVVITCLSRAGTSRRIQQSRVVERRIA